MATLEELGPRLVQASIRAVASGSPKSSASRSKSFSLSASSAALLVEQSSNVIADSPNARRTVSRHWSSVHNIRAETAELSIRPVLAAMLDIGLLSANIRKIGQN